MFNHDVPVERICVVMSRLERHILIYGVESWSGVEPWSGVCVFWSDFLDSECMSLKVR